MEEDQRRPFASNLPDVEVEAVDVQFAIGEGHVEFHNWRDRKVLTRVDRYRWTWRCCLSNGLLGKRVGGSFPVVPDHFVHKAFEVGDKRFWGVRDGSSSEWRMWVILDHEFGKFAGGAPERLFRNEQRSFETSHPWPRRKEIAIYHDPWPPVTVSDAPN
jgi:hypothetical protein